MKKTLIDEKLKNKENVTVYFYSPTCGYCKQTSPIVVPLAEKMNINLYLFNLLEFNDSWDQYHIEGTPTIIHFNKGIEKGRMEGLSTLEDFKKWFSEIK